MPKKAYKYRLYPTSEQEILFQKTFGCCRFIWNHLLADIEDTWNAYRFFPSLTPAMYKDEFPFLKEVDSLALTSVWKYQQQSFSKYFKDKKDKKKKKKDKAGKPKFKSKRKSKRSYTTFNQNGTVAVNAESSTVHLPKIDDVKAKLHRLPKEEWKLKSATVTQSASGKYMVFITFEYETEDKKPKEDVRILGLDYKSDGLYVDSNGYCAHMPHWFRRQQKKLAREQKRLARKTGSRKGEIPSSNWYKQNQKVNRIHEKAKNQRLDYLHKESRKLADAYDVIAVENIDMQNLSNKGFGNGKATLDNGYGMFRTMLAYKLEEKGGELVKVDKWFPSSQLCHVCGYRNKTVKDLLIRDWICPQCGTHHDRDENAALNIKNEGLRIYKEKHSFI